MKLVYFFTVHRYPEQLARLIRRLDGGDTLFFVHVDKKTDAATFGRMVDALRDKPNVTFLAKRYRCYPRAMFGALRATLDVMHAIVQRTLPCDYLIYLTGQDYPIKSNDHIKTALANAGGRTHILHIPLPYEGPHPTCGYVSQTMNRVLCYHLYLCNRYVRLPLPRSSPFWWLNPVLPRKRQFPAGFTPFGGWSYWCMPRAHVEYLDQFATANPNFVNFFKYGDLPDETFFQTVLLNSPLKAEVVNDDLRHIDWSVGGRHPKTFTRADFPALACSPQLFARKFDASVDAAVLDLIDEQLLNPANGTRIQ